MKYLRFLFSLALVFTLFYAGNAQKAIEKGYLKMEITDVSSDNEQMMAMAGMLKSSFTEIYFNNDKAFTKINMMGGMSETMVLVDLKTKENLMLMKMMGQKIKINMDEEELKEMQAGAEQPDVKYNHMKDETKEILGFKCHKVALEGMGDANMTMWITEDIKTTAHVSNGIQTEDLGGFPLEYVISAGGQMEMTMTATKFEEAFDEGVFNVDTEGFKEMTMDEFMESLGGMGGF